MVGLMEVFSPVMKPGFNKVNSYRQAINLYVV
jgi:hypothetical protein